MRSFSVLAVIAVLASSTHGQDPCAEGNHEIFKDLKGERSSNVHIEDVKDALCDRNLLEAWYRVESPAGTLMPTYTVASYNCSTVYPIWMNGTHPDATEGPVNRNVCATGLGVPCQEAFDIGVVNCTDFMLYFLSPPSQCDTAYCFGDRFPCPPGYQSPDGFQPGCEPIPTTPEPASTTLEQTTTTEPTGYNCVGLSSYSSWLLAASSLVVVVLVSSLQPGVLSQSHLT